MNKNLEQKLLDHGCPLSRLLSVSRILADTIIDNPKDSENLIYIINEELTRVYKNFVQIEEELKL